MLFTDRLTRWVTDPLLALIGYIAPRIEANNPDAIPTGLRSFIADEQTYNTVEVLFTDTTAMYFALAGTALIALVWLLAETRIVKDPYLNLLLRATAAAIALYVAFTGWQLLIGFHQFGGVFALSGALGTFVAMVACWIRKPKRKLNPVPMTALAAIAAIVTLALQAWGPAHMHDDNLGYTHLPRTDLQEGIVAYLEKEGDQDAMLVPPPWSINWLSYTGNPIMADYQTAHLMTYIPSLAPAIKQLHLEVYGDPVDESDEDTGQLDQWTEWDEAHWKELGQRYDFKYIIAPAFRAPNLPVVVENDDDFIALYKIPD